MTTIFTFLFFIFSQIFFPVYSVNPYQLTWIDKDTGEQCKCSVAEKVVTTQQVTIMQLDRF